MISYKQKKQGAFKMSILHECQTLHDVASIVNEAQSSQFYVQRGLVQTGSTSEQLAAEYAIDAAKDAGFGCGESELMAHLYILRDAGANFCIDDALEFAKYRLQHI